MRRFLVIAAVILAASLAAIGAWAKYNYSKNLEAAAQSKENVIGIDKKEVLARFGRPVAWGAQAEDGGQHRREVFLYMTWTKNVVVVLRDDKVTAIELEDVQRNILKEAQQYLSFKSWFAMLSRLVTGE